MSKNTTDLREQIYKIFRELGVPSADSGGMEKPYVIEAADGILTIIRTEKLRLLEQVEAAIDDGKRSHSMAVIRAALTKLEAEL